jgi:hypothetical protein
MGRYGLPFFFLLLVLAAAITLACGSPSSPERLLQSVTVSPATADAQSYPGGEVQFTATGYYNTRPSPVTPLATYWPACYQGASTTGVLVDQDTGVAQCAAGSVGTYTVFTENYSNSHGGCLGTSACGGGCFVTGTAQLTCP